MAGNVAPDMVNPAPERVAEFTVTAAVPEEVSVSVWLDFVLSVTFPNASVLVLTVS